MRRTLIACAILAAASFPTWAQKIETEKPDRNRIIQVQTALNHLTVIEVGEPVVTVAAGSSAFKIEWRENKVFIQPTEPNVATNLFIWTVSGRLNYELEPAGTVEGMHFAIDQPGFRLPIAQPKETTTLDRQKAEFGAMLGGQPIRMDNFKEPKNRVILLLKDVFEQDHQLFIRYSIKNGSKEPYDPGKPQVYTLDVQHSTRLNGMAIYQLTDDEAKRLKTTDKKSVQIIDGQLRSPHVGPGQETVGVVGVKLPVAKSDGPTVLRLIFPPDGNGPISAMLVL